jgi:hypothetical protein
MPFIRTARIALVVLATLLAGTVVAEAASYEDLLVNTTLAGNQQDPDVAMAGSGESLIVWTQQSSSAIVSGIYGRLYDNAGSATSGELLISPAVSAYRVNPHVCAKDGGGWVVVWGEFPSQSGNSRVYAQVLAADGAAAGGPVQMSMSEVDPGILMTDVTCLPGGGFVAVWTTHESGFSNIVAHRFAADGAPVGDRFVVNQSSAWIPSDAEIESDGTGRSLVIWSAGCPFYWTDCPTGPDGSDAATLARLYEADGTPAGPEFIVNSFTEGSQGATGFAAGFGSDGGFMVAFTNGDFDWPTAMTVCGHMPCGLLRARKFAADGAPLGDDFSVSDDEPGDHLHPTITADGAGGFLFVWELEQDVLYARDFDADNQPASDQFVLNDGDGYSRIPRLASLDGQFHMTWLSARSDRDVQHLFLTSLPTAPPVDPDDPPEPPPFTCPSVPSENCTLADPGKLRVRAGESSSALSWKWRDETGDPAQVEAMLRGITLCMYRDGALVDHSDVPGNGSASGASMWRNRTNRWTFERSADGLFGVRKLKIAHRSARSQFALEAESPDADLMRSASPILIQLYKSDGSCFQPPGL